LQKTLLYNNTVAKNLNFIKSLNYFPALFLILLFSLSNNVYAQEANSQQQITPTTIVLKDGANLYSADDNFNKQILSNKIILENSDVSYQGSGYKEHFLKLIARQSQREEKKDLKNQLKIAENKRQKEALQQIKREIEKFEKRVQVFVKLDFNDATSPDQFFSTNTIAKNYVTPSQSTHDFSKLYISADPYVVTQALDFLHSQKYTYYNNKSLNFCFSEVFSVRPPPVFLNA
jgi:hypothetical protein